MVPYEFLEHTADIKIRAYSRDMAEAFVNAARAVTEYLFGADVLGQTGAQSEIVKVDSIDRESLLVDWLSQIVFLSETRYRAYVRYSIAEMDDKHISADVGWIDATAEEDIKAVTYHELEITESAEGWAVTFVCDI